MIEWIDCAAGVRTMLGGWWPGAALLLVLAVTVALEARRPARVPRAPEPPGRFRSNALLGAASLALSALVPTLIAPLVARVQEAGVIGLLLLAGVGGWALFALSLAGVSLTAYLLHRAAHRWTWLWRLHRVHHADTALDVTTAFRHHPLEALVIAGVQSAAALTAGFDPLALALYGVVALLIAIPQHADLSLGRHEARLGGWVMTPGLHHVHHSAAQAETDSNYGDVVAVWDRLFGTWRRPSDMGVARIGLGEAEDAVAHRLGAQLGSLWRR